MYEYTLYFSHGIYQKAFRMEISSRLHVAHLHELVIDFWKRENPKSHHPYKILYPPMITVYEKNYCDNKRGSILKIHSYLK